MTAECLTVGDQVVYRGQSGTPVFDAKVTSMEVWVPILRKFVPHPDGKEGSVEWSDVSDRDDGRAVTVCVESLDNPETCRWGYGSQISPPRS